MCAYQSNLFSNFWFNEIVELIYMSTVHSRKFWRRASGPIDLKSGDHIQKLGGHYDTHTPKKKSSNSEFCQRFSNMFDKDHW
jgi:hypothetical protein